MTPERWQRIEEIFHLALDHTPDERQRYLDQVCLNDQQLKQKVQSLLTAHEAAGGFIEDAPMAGAISNVVSESVNPQPSLIGKKVGHYKVRSLLGTGGMGEVYLARDLNLDRLIALKILPSHFTADVTQVQRFEREARAVSALNNPHIITIHEIGEDGNLHFIATEFIEGKTLRQCLTDGPLPEADVISISSQVAEALSAAHGAGIVHRDIKPENVMVRPDGLVKVLDFGLAKLSDPELRTAGGEETATTLSLQTDAGMLMGTVSYFSPEQVERGTVDHRTDLFSLGVVIYEMCVGQRPFTGDSVKEVFNEIRHADPALSLLRTSRSRLGRIIERTLAKDPAARYQSAEELRSDLESLGRRDRSWWIKWAALLFVVFAASAIWFWQSRRSAERPVIFASAAQKLTDLPGEEVYPSLTPDGQSVVFASVQSGNWDIYRQTVGERSTVNLTAAFDSYDTQPAVSPDGSLIAFRSSREGGGVFLMNLDGTNVIKVTDSGFNPAWSPDGKELVLNDDNVANYESRNTYPSASKLWAVNVTTKTQRMITTRDAVQADWSPNGQRIAFWGEQKGGHRDIWTVASDGASEPVNVTDDGFIDWNPIWSIDGKHLYFLSNRGGEMNLWRVAIDEGTGNVKSAPQPATLPSNNCQHISFARNGKSLVYGQTNRNENVSQVDFDPVAGGIIGTPTFLTQSLKRYTFFSLAPDEQSFVYLARGEPQQDLFTADRTGAPQHRVTDDVAQDIVPRWSPRGDWIAFLSDRSGKYEIWKVRPDGSGLSQMTYEPGREVIAPVWSPDGNKLLYQIRNVNSYVIDANRSGTEQTPQPLTGEAPPGFIPWDWSADGTALVGWQPFNEDRSIVVYSFTEHRYQRFVMGIGSYPIWMSDTRRILFRESGSLYLLDRVTGTRREIMTLKSPAQIGNYAFSKDNRRLYYTSGSTEADIWLLKVGEETGR
jgi:serine/threonine protein kinase